MIKAFDIQRAKKHKPEAAKPKIQVLLTSTKPKILRKISSAILTLFLIVALVPLFQAFEAHMINVTADLVQLDAPIMTPPGPVAYDNTDGGTFTSPIDVFIVEFDPDATHVFYTFGSGTDPSTVPDPVCGGAFGGPKDDSHDVPLSADGVIKSIACNGNTFDSAQSAVNTKIYKFKSETPCAEGNAVVASHSTEVVNNVVTGTFTIAEGCTHIQISLASYKTLTPTFSLPQILFDSNTGFFDAGGPYTLTANIAPCYFQWDFVVGPVIENLAEDNLYGDRKLEWANGGTQACEETPPPVKIKAYKVVCLTEADLPNWGLKDSVGKPAQITATTAADFVAGSNNHCHLESDWNFQYGLADKAGTQGVRKETGDFVGPADGTSTAGLCDPAFCGTTTFTGTGYGDWKTFDASTLSGGVPAVVNISDLQGASGIWVREILKSGYVPFSYPLDPSPGSDVSAEMYCHSDRLNYDNFDQITGPVAGNTYYCIAFNAPKHPPVSPSQ